jgi:membrane-bound lytic murein transglycosylase A
VRPPPAQPGPGDPPGPPLDRAAIAALPADDALAWMRPEDLFFLQIQGSGVLVLEDGTRLKAGYAGSNGLPFVGVANVMIREGLTDVAHASGDQIRAWLAANRGPDADAVMDQDPRYIYFTIRPDDGAGPVGAAGVPLPPGRALAVDPNLHAFGDLFWIDAQAPASAGVFPIYRRVAAALDVGGAIKGEIRADLYTGVGEAAGYEAGRVRDVLRLYRLAPR